MPQTVFLQLDLKNPSMRDEMDKNHPSLRDFFMISLSWCFIKSQTLDKVVLFKVLAERVFCRWRRLLVVNSMQVNE